MSRMRAGRPRSGTEWKEPTEGSCGQGPARLVARKPSERSSRPAHRSRIGTADAEASEGQKRSVATRPLRPRRPCGESQARGCVRPAHRSRIGTADAEASEGQKQ